jgi:hypothetical protein
MSPPKKSFWVSFSCRHFSNSEVPVEFHRHFPNTAKKAYNRGMEKHPAGEAGKISG